MANRGITKENAMQMVELRRSMGKMGGRPPGVLDKKTIARIKDKQIMEQIMREKAGLAVDDLFRASQVLKVDASREILDRAFGKVPQGVQMQVATFSLKELAEYRKGLNNPPSIENQIIQQGVDQALLPDALQDVQTDSEKPAEKKT